MVALCFYEVLRHGQARLRLSVESSVLGSSQFAYGEGTPLVDICGAASDRMHGCGEYTMMSDDDVREEPFEGGDDEEEEVSN